MKVSLKPNKVLINIFISFLVLSLFTSFMAISLTNTGGKEDQLGMCCVDNFKNPKNEFQWFVTILASIFNPGYLLLLIRVSLYIYSLLISVVWSYMWAVILAGIYNNKKIKANSQTR